MRWQAARTESITGSSTTTPSTVASVAPDSGPKSVIAVVTTSSNEFEAPTSAPGEVIECSTFSHFIGSYAKAVLGCVTSGPSKK